MAVAKKMRADAMALRHPKAAVTCPSLRSPDPTVILQEFLVVGDDLG